MENTTALLWRQEDTLAERHLLVVEADDESLRNLPHQRLFLHSDLTSVVAHQYGPWPEVPEGVDLLVVILPKSRERLELVLTALSNGITQPTELWLVGPTKGGIKGALKQMKTYVEAEEVAVVDTARRCRLYAGMLQPQQGHSLADFAHHWQAGEDAYVSYPGVFSHGRLDAGTALLLEHLPASLVGLQALDVGCGAGVISLALAQRGAQVTATDVSATAAAATRATLAANGVAATVAAGDLYGELTGPFDMIVTNPPFHEGIQRTTEVTERLIQQAPTYLTPEGELWLVANHGLPYEACLKAAFRSVQVVASNNRFNVWRAE